MEKSSEPSPSLPMKKSFKPAGRREKTCPCTGFLLVMLGNYGWIEAEGDIDHPEAARNGGRVFVHASDMSKKCRAGDRVTFYLYCDDQGLGAEDCKFSAELVKPPANINFDMDSFPTLATAGAAPAVVAEPQGHSDSEATRCEQQSSLRASAPEFVPPMPTAACAEAEAEAFEAFPSAYEAQMPLPAYFEEEAYGYSNLAAPPAIDMCQIIDELFSDGSDSEEEEERIPEVLRVARPKSALPNVKSFYEESTKSTASGDDSSDESDDAYSLPAPVTPPPGLEAWGPCKAFRPPPGLPEPETPCAATPCPPGLMQLPPWRQLSAC